MSNRTDRAIHAAIVGLAIAGWLWLGMTLFTGCGFLKDGIDVMIRPGGKLHETPKVPVSPAPPQPPPPKDDWAPPFFHRPKTGRAPLKKIDFTKFTEPNPKSLNSNPIPKVKR